MKLVKNLEVKNIAGRFYISKEFNDLLESLIDEEIKAEEQRIREKYSGRWNRVAAAELHKINYDSIKEDVLAYLTNDDVLFQYGLKVVSRKGKFYFIDKNTYAFRFVEYKEDMFAGSRCNRALRMKY